MAGIYVHIPFCRQACHYCDFHFSTSKHGVAPLLKAIGQELKLQRHYLEGQQIRTLYFGGGTPSIVPAGEIARLIDQVRTEFPMAPDAEITLEANPDDIQASLVREWMGAGINRLSIGIQSFADSDLQWLNRAHHAGQAEGSVKISQDTGIENITIDLIYGIPVSADGQWQRNVQQAIELQVPHISAYCLTIEEKTVFGHRYRKGELSPLPDTTSASQFLYLVNTLETSGIHLYEVSNFSKPGFESKHNSAYWTGDHYLGIGPSAHSFNGESRQWNVANNHQYAREIESGRIPFTLENIGSNTRFNEYMMTGLRTRAGINTGVVEQQWGIRLYDEYAREIEVLENSGDLVRTAAGFRLTLQGMLRADRIASDFFIVD